MKNHLENCKTITQIASEYNISLRALRYFEQRKLISPKRVGSERLYSKSDEHRLKMILDGRRLRFSLRQLSYFIKTQRGSGRCESFIDRLDQVTLKHKIELLKARRKDIHFALNDLEQSLKTITSGPLATASQRLRKPKK